MNGYRQSSHRVGQSFPALFGPGHGVSQPRSSGHVSRGRAVEGGLLILEAWSQHYKSIRKQLK